MFDALKLVIFVDLVHLSQLNLWITDFNQLKSIIWNSNLNLEEADALIFFSPKIILHLKIKRSTNPFYRSKNSSFVHMKSILIKELNSFFAQPIGYVVIGVFLLFCNLFLWTFNGDFNLFNYGFAHLAPFFELISWLLLFMVPALIMKSISEEKKQATLEVLMTKPITTWQLCLGKFIGNWLVVGIAFVPTFLYVLSLIMLAEENAVLELGSFFVSYIGSLLLAGCFVSISLFSSASTNNQLISFLLGISLCFVCFFAFEGITQFGLFGDEGIGLEYLSLSYHFKSMTRGVMDTRNIIFMASVIVFFLYLTRFQLQKMKA